MSLKKQTLTGLFWGFLSQGGKQFCQFVITAVLAMLLLPDDFGLVGMATVFSGFAFIFAEMGVSSALIQKAEVSESHYDSAFWLNLVVGSALSLLMFLISPFVASFYAREELRPILSVIGINFFISSFVIVQRARLEKNMEFKKIAVIELAAVILSGAFGVYLAYSGKGVWSLVLQTLVLTALTAVGLWIASSWRPKFQFSKKAIIDIYQYSLNMTGFQVVNYFSRNIDYLLIGKFLGAELLGYYTLAYKLMLYPLQNITSVVTRVTFPAFSKIQHDYQKIRTNYLKMVKMISFVTFPLMGGVFVLAPEIVTIIFGEKWLPTITLIRILCVAGMIQSVGTTVGNIRLAIGESKLHLKMGIQNAVIAGCVIGLSLKWGIVGVAIGYTLFSWGWYHYSVFATLRLVGLTVKDFIASLLPTYALTGGMVGSMFLVKKGLGLSGDLISALVVGLVGMLSYGALLVFTKQINPNEFLNKKLMVQGQK